MEKTFKLWMLLMLMTSGIVSCVDNYDNPAPVVDDKPFTDDKYIDQSVRPGDKTAFEQKQEQLITLWGQLEHYPGQPADGRFTLRENMADYGGVTLALEAYTRRLKSQGFSGKQYDDQLNKFFLAYGLPVSVEPRERDVEKLKQSYTSDTHSAGHNRVNGILRLFDEWYRIYEVKSTDKLYVAPADRVRIW